MKRGGRTLLKSWFFFVQGAHLHVRDKDGNTARSLALNNNYVRIVTLIDNAIRLLQEEGQGKEGEGRVRRGRAG